MPDPLYHEATPSELAKARHSRFAAVRCQVDDDEERAGEADRSEFMARVVGVCIAAFVLVALTIWAWDALTGVAVSR